MSSSSTAPAWQWDENRQTYYIWYPTEGYFLYQDGTRIYSTAQAHSGSTATGTASAASGGQNDPRSQPSVDAFHARAASATSTDSTVSAGYTYGAQNDDSLSSRLEIMNLGQSHSGSSATLKADAEQAVANDSQDDAQAAVTYHPRQSPYQYQQAGHAAHQQVYLSQSQVPGVQNPQQYHGQYYSQNPQSSEVYTAAALNQPQQNLQETQSPLPYSTVVETFSDPRIAASHTDPSIYTLGQGSVLSRGRLMQGTPGEEEEFDREYRVHRPGKKFFRFGKVFKIYWPEPLGQTPSSRTEVTKRLISIPGQWNQQFFAKIRWFVVIKPGEGHYCSCLPIQTYSNQGVAKNGVNKHHHAIMYTGSEEPTPNPEELPNLDEHAMLQSIRVVSNKKTDTMDPMSRVNFVKVFTVEHNVKVYDFGDVHPKFRHVLRHQFNDVWQKSILVDGDDESDEEEDKMTRKKKSTKPTGKRRR